MIEVPVDLIVDEKVRDAIYELDALHGEDKVRAAICSLGFDFEQLMKKVDSVTVMAKPVPIVLSKDPEVFINPDMNAIATEVENDRKFVQLNMIRDRVRNMNPADVARWLAASRKVTDASFSFDSLPPTPWQLSQARKAEKRRQAFLAESAAHTEEYLQQLMKSKIASDFREVATNNSKDAYAKYISERDKLWAQRADELRARHEKIRAAAEAAAEADRKRRLQTWRETARKLKECRERRAQNLILVAGTASGIENKAEKLHAIYVAAKLGREEKAAEISAKQAERAAALKAAEEAAAELRKIQQDEFDARIRRKNEAVQKQQAEIQKAKEEAFKLKLDKFENIRFHGNALLSARAAAARKDLDDHFQKNAANLSALKDKRILKNINFKKEYKRHTALAEAVKDMGVKCGVALVTHRAERVLWEGAAADNAKRLAKEEETKKAYILLRVALTQRKVEQVKRDREEMIRLKQNTARLENVKKDKLKATFDFIKAETDQAKIQKALSKAGVHQDIAT